MARRLLVPHFRARVEIRGYADVTVEAEDEDQARDFAVTAGYETMYPEISDIDVEWIEELERPTSPEK